LLGRARAVLAEARALGAAAEALRDPLAGTLRLGVIPTLGPTLLPGLLAQVGQELPRLDLRIEERQSAALLEDVRSGELDAALVALPYEAPGVVVRPLFDEALVLLAPVGHPLAGTGPVDATQVSDHPLLLLEQGHCLRDHVLRVCPGQDTDSPARVTSLGTLIALVRAGVGPALVPQGAVGPDLRDDPAVVVRALAPPEPSRGVALWWRRGTARQVVLRRLESLLIESR